MTDAELAGRASAGDISAFEELYRRHAQAAWRVAQSVTGNAEDSADAVSDAFTRVFKSLPSGRLTANANFRAYLLTATRNAALDVHRRTGRVKASDDDTVFDKPSGDGPTDKAMERLDAAMVASAFRSLPERWRSVLWLTEVEGIPAREAAGMLGVSANGVAQLAVRARAGLRERFLQAHITHKVVDDGCKHTVERLGAYVAGALAPRDLAKVDQHLAGCADCRARKEELEDLGSGLRRIVLPIPLGLGALAVAKWELASTSAAATAGSAAGALPAWLEKAQRPLAVASVGLFAAGILGVGVVGQAPAPPGGRSRATVPAADVAAPAVTFVPASAVSTGTGSSTGGGFGSVTSRGSNASTGSDSDGGGFSDDDTVAGDAELDALRNTTSPSTPTTLPTGTTPTTSPTTTTPTTQPTTTTTPPTTAPPAKPDAQAVISVTAADTTLAAAAGTGENSCTGTSTGVGSCTPPSSSGPVKVTVDGAKLPTGISAP